VKAVENGGTAIGIRCKDGVVLAVEKLISSKLLKPGANKRIATVDRNIGIVRNLQLFLTPSAMTVTC
jgi:20S proteasome subunit alpha 7